MPPPFEQIPHVSNAIFSPLKSGAKGWPLRNDAAASPSTGSSITTDSVSHAPEPPPMYKRHSELSLRERVAQAGSTFARPSERTPAKDSARHLLAKTKEHFKASNARLKDGFQRLIPRVIRKKRLPTPETIESLTQEMLRNRNLIRRLREPGLQRLTTLQKKEAELAALESSALAGDRRIQVALSSKKTDLEIAKLEHELAEAPIERLSDSFKKPLVQGLENLEEQTAKLQDKISARPLLRAVGDQVLANLETTRKLYMNLLNGV